MDLRHDPGLVLHLPLYESDGASFISRDKHGHLATVTGALWTPQGRSFDGADDVIVIGSSVSVIAAGTGGITISYWVKPNSVTGDYVGLVRAGLATPSSTRLLSAFTGGNLYVYDGVWNNTGKTLSLGVFSYVSWIRKDGVLRLYINGVDTGWSKANAGVIGPMDEVHIGRHAATLDGIMGEVFIYLRGFSLLEDQQNYLATKRRYQ